MFSFAEKFHELLEKFLGATTTWDGLMNTFKLSSMMGKILPFVMLGVCALLLLFGKKLLPVVKVCVLFFAGFFATMKYVVPLINDHLFKLPDLGGYIVAAVLGVVAAILSKFLWILLYVGGSGAGVGYLLYSGAVTTKKIAGLDIKGNLIVAIVAGVVVAVLAVLLRKVIAVLATTAVGAYGIVYLLTVKITMIANPITNIVSKVGLKLAIAQYVLLGVLAVIGLLVQIKTNRKYRI